MSDEPMDVGLGLEYLALAEDMSADCGTPDIEPLLREEGRPLFADSWEAEAFAIGKILVAEGMVTPKEWYDVISEEILKAQAAGDPDRGDTHYLHWMSALERICVEKGLVDGTTLEEHIEIWGRAVANTPHGVPIAFENAFVVPEAVGHDHSHADVDPEPMAVHVGQSST
ncbi:MAG: nitrile hydratase accessory protein [Candidatus Nanopelagicales bacterium]